MEKFQKQINLRNLFNNNLLCWKIFTQYIFFFSTKLRFVGKLSQLALKLLCKTPNEVFVESIGSVLEKNMKPQGPGKQVIFVSEMHNDWNGPVVSKANNVLVRSLDRKFGSRKKWNFKSGNTKFYNSAVFDRKRVESSRLSLLEKKKLMKNIINGCN